MLSDRSVAGLFAGIGGIEVGLESAGFHSRLLCEIEPAAQAVLRARFEDVEMASDIRELKEIPPVEIVAGGFPCQDLSQAGRTAGITGSNSGLIQQVFRLLGNPALQPRWLVLENVPFMLSLDKGHAMSYLTASLESLGFAWAYRVVDTRAFGLPQRRQRVVLLASRDEDPRGVLLNEDAGPREQGFEQGVACGFYWTEGLRGLGWATNAVPTLKGGSTVGIPSPPAIWMPDGEIVTPDIRDAERLQGFPADWTLPATNEGFSRGARWKLVGNAVSTPVFEWLGKRLSDPEEWSGAADSSPVVGHSWPRAAFGSNGQVFRVDRSEWPVNRPQQPLGEFLAYPTTPLSLRAARGFRSRTRQSGLRFPAGFLNAVDHHINHIESSEPALQRLGAD
jgi:DNA (cytosine-5)-methyltransferase 1